MEEKNTLLENSFNEMENLQEMQEISDTNGVLKANIPKDDNNFNNNLQQDNSNQSLDMNEIQKMLQGYQQQMAIMQKQIEMLAQQNMQLQQELSKQLNNSTPDYDNPTPSGPKR